MANFRIGLLLPGIAPIGKMLRPNRNVLDGLTHKTYALSAPDDKPKSDPSLFLRGQIASRACLCHHRASRNFRFKRAKIPVQGEWAMRVYLVIVDESDEARVALRFATRRAIKTQGQVHILALVPPQPFSAFGGIQATIEEEARARAETIAAAAAGSVLSQAGHMPVIAVVSGDPVKAVREYLSQHSEVAALVLGAPAGGGASGAGQGPLIGHFTGAGLGALSCPLFIVPGGMDEAEIDRLS